MADCSNLKPKICGNRGLPMPNDNCDVIRFEGVEDTEINQGVCIDLTEGVHAYDGDGSEIEYTVSPSEIGCCDVGEHEVTYTAVGKGNKMLPSFCLGKPMLTTANCGLMTKAVTRLVTVLQALPPKILGIGRTIIAPSTTFDPMSGVSGVDDNGNATEVTYEGRYDLSTGKQNIASFESDIEGVYPITYHTEDVCGNETTETRYVIVANCDDDSYEPKLCQGRLCCASLTCNYSSTVCEAGACYTLAACEQTEIIPSEA